MRILFILFILLSIHVVYSNEKLFQINIKNEGNTIADFIPNDWILIDSAIGNLNGDNLEDIALVIESKDSVISYLFNRQISEVITNEILVEKFKRRVLLILFKDSLTKKFNLVEQNYLIIPSHNNTIMKDPFKDILIKSNYLKIILENSSISDFDTNTSVYYFSYRYQTFVLIEVDKFNYNQFTFKIEINKFDCLNGRWGVSRGDIYSSSSLPLPIEWKKLETLVLKDFKIFGKPFTWLVAEGFYL